MEIKTIGSRFGVAPFMLEYIIEIEVRSPLKRRLADAIFKAHMRSHYGVSMHVG